MSDELAMLMSGCACIRVSHHIVSSFPLRKGR